MQVAFVDAKSEATGGTGGAAGGSLDFGGAGDTGNANGLPQSSFLAQVSLEEALVSRTMKVCDMEPFWEKGQTVYDLKNCRLSPVKMIIWSLIPAMTMLCGLLGLWSRQRNVRGRGKETQVSNLVSLGISLLASAYDWFFGWTIYRNPIGDFQQRFYEVGLACLIADAVINFLMVHFWFRRKFLVGMPWYEFHKHGVGLHLIFLIMYLQPQASVLFTCRAFDMDVFNIHFGTPSKMNEVLSNMSCLSILSDLPMLTLKVLVFSLDSTGLEAPKVTRVSMGLTVISMGFVIKRYYVASIERQWYQEIVRMAGVRRLTTYGGASRWLKFQKRPSATADVAGASNSQQQLFLAWMQSMGRRQESIFQDAASQQLALTTDKTGDEEISDDSEDEMESISESESSSEEEESEDEDEGTNASKSEKSSRQNSSRAASSRPTSSRTKTSSTGEESEEEDSEEDEGEDDEETNSQVEKQSYKRKRGKQRLAKEERPLGRRGLDGESDVLSSGPGGLLGFARGVADEVGGNSSMVSESDIMAFARRAANKASESGVVTESFGEDGFSDADVFSETSGSDALLNFARTVAKARDLSSGTGVSMGAESDVLAFARKIANGASDSGVGDTAVTDGSDIFAFARKAARAVSGSGVSGAGSESDIMAYARKAAEGLSGVSGGGSESDVLAFARQVAGGLHSEATGTSFTQGASAVTSQKSDDIFAFARRMAKDVSRSGVSSEASGGESNLFAYAAKVAGGVSHSGVGGASEASSNANESDIFALARQAAEGGAAFAHSGTGTSFTAGTGAESDILQYAQKVADNVSHAGFSHDSEASAAMRKAMLLGGGDSQSGAGSRSEVESDVMAFARRMAQEVSSRSGVGTSKVDSEDIFVAARRAASDASGAVSSVASGGQSDLFAFARGAAEQVSQSGVKSVSVAGSELRGGIQDLFANAESRSGVASETSDLFVAARRAAEQVSQSGVHSVSAVGSNMAGGIHDLFAQAESKSGVASETSDLDLFADARRAAEQVSRSGVQSSADTVGHLPRGMKDLFVPVRAQASDSRSGVSDGSDFLAAARGAAEEVSRSGVQSSASGASQTLAAITELFSANKAGSARSSGVPVAPPEPGQASDSGVSDLFAYAQGAADEASRSGVQSSAASSGAGLDTLFAGRGASARGQQQREASEVSASSAGNDLIAFARRAAGEASRSGVQSSVAGANTAAIGDLFVAAARVGSSARSQAADPVAPPNPEDLRSEAASSVGGSDLFAIARGAADQASRSGVQSSVTDKRLRPAGVSELFVAGARRGSSAQGEAPTAAGPTAPPRPEDEVSSIGGSELFAAAAAAAEDARSGIASSAGSDLFAVARGAADQVSRSGVQSAAAAAAPGNLGDLFAPPSRAPARRMEAPAPPPEPEAASSVAGSDLMAIAAAAAGQASRSGVQSSLPMSQAAAGVGDLFSAPRRQAPPPSDGGDGLDFLDAARAAADEFSQSGVGSGSDILGAARNAADEMSQSGVGEDSGSDIFGAAQQAADEMSRSGVGSQPGAGANFSVGRAAGPKKKAGAGKAKDFEFAPQPRQFAAAGRHSQAPPPPPPRRRPISPPGSAPPLPARTFLTDTWKAIEEGQAEASHAAEVSPATEELAPMLSFAREVAAATEPATGEDGFDLDGIFFRPHRSAVSSDAPSVGSGAKAAPMPPPRSTAPAAAAARPASRPTPPPRPAVAARPGAAPAGPRSGTAQQPGVAPAPPPRTSVAVTPPRIARSREPEPASSTASSTASAAAPAAASEATSRGEVTPRTAAAAAAQLQKPEALPPIAIHAAEGVTFPPRPPPRRPEAQQTAQGQAKPRPAPPPPPRPSTEALAMPRTAQVFHIGSPREEEASPAVATGASGHAAQPLSPSTPGGGSVPGLSPRMAPAERQQRLEMRRRMREGDRDYKRKHNRTGGAGLEGNEELLSPSKSSTGHTPRDGLTPRGDASVSPRIEPGQEPAAAMSRSVQSARSPRQP
eukprot:TRINITY_DN20208_c0_g1_i1.p1 TRINITY_DN20208_c0_g1~~TRINITY_DN20208_c0_g1_i1.p1  ORF type:complete len:2091 (-),score=488.04 TRINITY_DN20208_c0_g1_i1:45-6011(-)